jgi:hypothetical protein
VSESQWGQEPVTASRNASWSTEQVDRFREMYGLRDESAIARELKCTVANVREMATAIYKGMPKTGPWSSEEQESLLAYLGASTMQALCHVMGRSQEDIDGKLVELAVIKTDAPFDQEDVARFKRLYGTRRDEDLAIIFGRRLGDIQDEAKKLCIAKDKAFIRRTSPAEKSTRMPRWGSSDLTQLRELYPIHSNLDIAQRLQRSVKSVVSKAHNLGLRKDPARLKEMGRENVSLRYGATNGDNTNQNHSAQ